MCSDGMCKQSLIEFRRYTGGNDNARHSIVHVFGYLIFWLFQRYTVTNGKEIIQGSLHTMKS